MEKQPLAQITDTNRLDFLLQYFYIDDIGDEEYCKGMCISHEALEEKLSFTPNGSSNIELWKEDLRTVIDRAIKFNVLTPI